MRAVIVEDEKIAREVLRNYLTKYCPTVELIGEAENIKEAVPLIENKRPDLVFLDIEMPFGNGFDVLEACKDIPFETIFITAYSEYAIKALNMSASYYLLKPLSIDELILAVDKVELNLKNKTQILNKQVLLHNLHSQQSDSQIILPTMDGFEVLLLKDILRLQGNGNFTDLYLQNGTKKMVCRFLKYFEELLPPNFIRVHKSHIINTKAVVSYHKGLGGYVLMSDKSEINISSAYKETFLKYFASI